MLLILHLQWLGGGGQGGAEEQTGLRSEEKDTKEAHLLKGHKVEARARSWDESAELSDASPAAPLGVVGRPLRLCAPA